MRRFLAMLGALGLAACGASGGQQTGGVTMDITAAGGAAVQRSALGSTGGTLVTLTVDGPGSYDEAFTSTTLPWSFSDKPCPVGAYTYTLTARVGSAKFSASGSFEVSAGKMTDMSVVMQQDDETPMNVTAPFIQQITVTGLNDQGSGGWGEKISLKAKVLYPDNDAPDMDHFFASWSHACIGDESKDGFFSVPFEYNYYSDLFGGFFIPAVDVRTSFTSFCQGKEKITLQAVNTDRLLCPECELVSRVSFEIPYDDQGMYGLINVNYAPQVTCDLVDNAEPLPGSEVTVKALVSDKDGDAIDTIAWSDDCGGAFVSGADTLQPIWKAPEANCKACVLRLDVKDARGGENYGTITLKTAPADVTLGCVSSQ